MKKLLAGIVVLALANMAFAVPAFQINGGNPIELQAGVPLTVPVTVVDVPAAMSMVLNLETQAPFQFTDLVVDKDAGGNTVAGLAFSTNTTGAAIFSQFREIPGVGFTPPDAIIGSVSTASGTVAMNPATVALVTLLAPAGTPVGTAGTVSTADGQYQMGDSAVTNGLGEVVGIQQSTVGVTVVPEPVSALLLLAGLPLIRRRRA